MHLYSVVYLVVNDDLCHEIAVSSPHWVDEISTRMSILAFASPTNREGETLCAPTGQEDTEVDLNDAVLRGFSGDSDIYLKCEFERGRAGRTPDGHGDRR